MCLDQLQCAGVFDAVRIKKSGWPFRLSHEAFLDRYGEVHGFSSTGTVSDCKKIVAKMKFSNENVRFFFLIVFQFAPRGWGHAKLQNFRFKKHNSSPFRNHNVFQRFPKKITTTLFVRETVVLYCFVVETQRSNTTHPTHFVSRRFFVFGLLTKDLFQLFKVKKKCSFLVKRIITPLLYLSNRKFERKTPFVVA